MAMLPNPLPALAADPTGSSLGLTLPPGRLVHDTEDGPASEPLLWMAELAAGPQSWADALPARAVGLLPVLLNLDGSPLVGWELSPATMSYPGDHDAEEVLAGYWTGEAWQDEEEDNSDEGADAEAEADDEEAHHDWPGLAPALPPQADPDERAAEIAGELAAAAPATARVALVHARRSADIPAAIGWCGPLNHDNDVARLCAVLRSWEERFGIRVVGLGFDTLTVSVAAPPRTPEEAAAVAAEHYAFCPDNIDQGCGSLEEYAAKEVLDRTAWTFWWD
ncbi:DUF4253 domain-containing protein [Streptomyces sp. NPDC021020]|uniref:DUF4253 domain-containing protein n=1 Tax=Streptomyces sp. NPDC021020 TaxID=3365109 RepID=UPI0037A6FD27